MFSQITDQPDPALLFDKVAAAKMLGGISPRTIENLIANGQVKATRIGARVFVSRAELERVAAEGAAGVQPLTGRAR